MRVEMWKRHASLEVTLLLLATIGVLVATSIPTMSKLSEIKIPREHNWKLDFLTPPQGYFKEDEAQIHIYNFVSPDDKKYNLSIMFHEFHWKFKVFLCNTTLISPIDSLEIPLEHHGKNTSEVGKACEEICPIQSPVAFFGGPAFLEIIYKPPHAGLFPKRGHLLPQSRANVPFFNVTYEMHYVEDTAPKFIHVNDTLLRNNFPCNLNGIPVLYKLDESSYEFKCSCRFSTYGHKCEWGTKCPREDSRSACSNHGTCREIENLFECKCDRDYYGPKCLHFSYFSFEEGQSCHPNCTFCHIIPNGIKCACGPGFRLQNRSCVPETTDVILSYSLSRIASKEEVKEEFKRLLSAGLKKKEFHPEFSLDPQLKRLTIHGLTIGNARLINTRLFLDCLLNDSCSHPAFSEEWITRTNETSMIENLYPFQQLKGKAIQAFKFKVILQSKKLEICCYTIKERVNVFFYKDGHKINEKPVVPPLRRDGQRSLWSDGNYSILYDNGLKHGFCLWVDDPIIEDFGLYQCEVSGSNIYEKRNIITHGTDTKIGIEIEPRSLTIQEGSNISLLCKVKAISSYESYFKFHLDVEPKESYEIISKFAPSRSTLIITLINLTDDVNLTCSAVEIIYKDLQLKCDTSDTALQNIDGGGFAKAFISISVLQVNEPHCEEDEHLNIKWGITKAESTQRSECPSGYEGFCERHCSFGASNPAPSWRTPDCSRCTKESIKTFFKKLLIYKRGIRSYFPTPDTMMKNLSLLVKNSTYLPGEVGGIVRQLSSFLALDQLKPSFDEFWNTIESLLEAEKPFTESDLIAFKALLSEHPWKSTDATCLQKISEKRNLVAYLQNRLKNSSLSVDVSIYPPERDTWKQSQSQCLNLELNGGVHIKIEGASQRISSIVFVLFWKASSFLPYWKKTVEGDCCYAESTFSQVASPFIQVNSYTNSSTKALQMTDIETSLTFSHCGHNLTPDRSSIRYELKCGQYLPAKNKWKKCSLRRSSNGRCTCTCKGTDGWIGLICSDNEIIEEETQAWGQNHAVAIACCISLFILTAALFSLFWTNKELPFTTLISRVVDILSNIVLNSVFLRASITDPQKHPNSAFFIMVSCCFFISLCMSVSFQISFLSKCSSNNNNPFVITSQMAYSSFLVFIFSTVLAGMLAIILWMILKVESITLTCFWLPDKTASSMTVVALSSVSLCFLLLVGIALFNFLRLRCFKCYSPEITIRTLFVELRNFCVLFSFQFLLVVASIFRKCEIGRYPFLVTDISLALLLLYVYGFSFRRQNQSGESRENAKFTFGKFCCCCNNFLLYIFSQNEADNDSNDKGEDTLSREFSELEGASRVDSYPREPQLNFREVEQPSTSQRQDIPNYPISEGDDIDAPPHLIYHNCNREHHVFKGTFDNNSNISCTPRYLPMKPIQEISLLREYPSSIPLVYQNLPPIGADPSLSTNEEERNLVVKYEPKTGLNNQTSDSNTLNPHRSLDIIKIDDNSGQMSSENCSYESSGRSNSARPTLKSGEVSPRAKSLHSSPFLGPDRSKGLFRKVSSKLSLLANRTKGSKRHFGSGRIAKSYGLLDGNNLIEDSRSQTPDVNKEDKRVHRRQHSF